MTEKPTNYHIQRGRLVPETGLPVWGRDYLSAFETLFTGGAEIPKTDRQKLEHGEQVENIHKVQNVLKGNSSVDIVSRVRKSKKFLSNIFLPFGTSAIRLDDIGIKINLELPQIDEEGNTDKNWKLILTDDWDVPMPDQRIIRELELSCMFKQFTEVTFESGITHLSYKQK